MHPLISAWLRLKKLNNLNIRLESWYYGQWIRMIVQAENDLQELMEVYK